MIITIEFTMEDLDELYACLDRPRTLLEKQINILRALVIKEMNVMRAKSKTTPRAITTKKHETSE